MEATVIDRLVFVYNADGGIVNGFVDAVHKIVSPGTYSCSLCAITYGKLAMEPRWRAWLETLAVPVAFHHRNDFLGAYPGVAVRLPVVLAERAGEVTTLVGAERLDALGSVDALIAEIEGAMGLGGR